MTMIVMKTVFSNYATQFQRTPLVEQRNKDRSLESKFMASLGKVALAATSPRAWCTWWHRRTQPNWHERAYFALEVQTQTLNNS